MNSRRKISLTVSVIFCLLGGYLIFYSTTYGLGVGSDSVEYYEVGRNLAAGRGLVVIRASGLVVPLYLRPPMYSIVLGIAHSAGFIMLEFNRYLNIILFVVFLFVLGWGTYLLDRRYLYPICFILLIITSPTFIQAFSYAMSEPIFFSLGILSVSLLISYLQSRNRIKLSLSALLAGMTSLTRFNGAAFILVGVILLLWECSKKTNRAFRDLLLFLSFSLSPMILWLIGLFKVGYTPGVYQFEGANFWSGLAPFRISLVDHMWKWFPVLSILGNIKYRMKLLVLLLLMICLLILVTSLVRKARSGRNGDQITKDMYPVAVWLLLFIISIAILAFSYIFVEFPKPALDDRVFSPIQLSFWGSILAILFFIAFSNRKAIYPWIFICVFVFGTIAFNIPKTVSVVTEFHEKGIALTSNRWRSSGVIREVLKLPESVAIISNETAAILFYTERPAYEIPELTVGIPVEAYRPFGTNLNNVEENVFQEQGAALVVFDSVYWQFWTIYEQDTQRRLDEFISGLYLYYDGWDGSIYFANPP